MLKIKIMDLTKYNGKIYSRGDKFALKINSGSFHYVDKPKLIEAFNNGFIVGYDKRLYSNMPWGTQHIGNQFETNSLLRDKFISEVYRNWVVVHLNYYVSWIDKMYISRDNESLEIGINLSEDSEPIVLCYWNSDEWLEDPESVVPAMLSSQELFYTNKKKLLDTLGYIAKD